MASTYILVLALAASVTARASNLSAVAVGPGNLDQYGPYFQGDMRFGEDQLQELEAKSGILGDRYRWPNAQVFVQFDSRFTNNEKNTIISGLQDISDKTCIRFYYRRSSDTDYVNIVRGGSGSGCWSYVGKQGGKQDLNLQSNGCIYKGIAAHEMIHALGYFHEQSRPDRDDYVRIELQNVQRGMEHNFDKYDDNQVSTFGVEYDYKSIMHYDQYAFSTNRQPTIVPTRSGVRGSDMGQRDGLTDKDAQKLKNMYKC